MYYKNINLRDVLDYLMSINKKNLLLVDGELKKPCNLNVYKVKSADIGYELLHYEGDIEEKYIKESIYSILNNIEKDTHEYNLKFEIVDQAKTIYGLLSKINDLITIKHKEKFLLQKHDFAYQMNKSIIFDLHPIKLLI